MADGTGLDGVEVKDFGGHAVVVRRTRLGDGGSIYEEELGGIHQYVTRGIATHWVGRYWIREPGRFTAYRYETLRFPTKEEALTWVLTLVRME